jgi:hypothetical protein
LDPIYQDSLSDVFYESYSFKSNGFDFTRVPVKGMMVSENIYQACLARGLRPVCDYPSYADGKCVSLGTRNNWVSRLSVVELAIDPCFYRQYIGTICKYVVSYIGPRYNCYVWG